MNTNTITKLSPELDKVPYSAANFVADGVRKFYVLDFDGVINPYSHNTLPKGYYNPNNSVRIANPNYEADKAEVLRTRAHVRVAKSFVIRWSSDLIDDLNDLFADPTAQVIFLTTWRGDMATIVDSLGMKAARPFYFLPWGSASDFYNHFHKIDAAVDFFTYGDFDPTDVYVHWADDVLFKKSILADTDDFFGTLLFDNVFMLAPNDKTGYSRDEIVAVKTFMNGDSDV